MLMISHHRMRDNDNGPDRVIEYILTNKRHKRHRYQCHKRHRYHQYNQWLSKSRAQYLMKTLVAPEDEKDPELSLSTSCAIKNHSGVKTAEWRKPAHNNSHRL